jgi:hypothetical protein
MNITYNQTFKGDFLMSGGAAASTDHFLDPNGDSLRKVRLPDIGHLSFSTEMPEGF